MSNIDEHGRVTPPADGGEAETLLAFLDFHRATLAWKCRDLNADGLAHTVASSSLTLGKLLKHLALVEDYWFGYILAGNEPGPPWDTVDWDSDPDWEMNSAGDDPPERLHQLWNTAVTSSRRLTAEVMAEGGGPDTTAARVQGDKPPPTLRWILLHMIEEYARHNGHADLLREDFDGLTGE